MRYVDTICKRIPAADSHQACVQHPPVLKKKTVPPKTSDHQVSPECSRVPFPSNVLVSLLISRHGNSLPLAFAFGISNSRKRPALETRLPSGGAP